MVAKLIDGKDVSIDADTHMIWITADGDVIDGLVSADVATVREPIYID